MGNHKFCSALSFSEPFYKNYVNYEKQFQYQTKRSRPEGLCLNPFLLFTAQEIKQFTQPFFSSEDFHLPQNPIAHDSVHDRNQ